MNRIQKIIIPSMVTLLLISACSEESDTSKDAGIHPIEFTTIDLNNSTRISPDGTVFENGEAFGVLAYRSSDGTLNGIGLPDLLYNAKAEKYINPNTNDAGYRYIPTVFWPDDGTKVMFAAYFPHNSTVSTEAITVTPQYDAGLPEYTVILGRQNGRLDFATAEVGPIYRKFTAIDASNPPVVANNDPAGTPVRKNNYVNFHFKRQMSYLSFRVKALNLGTNYRLFINAVYIRNVNNKGIYGTTNATSGARGWKNLSVDATTGASLKVSSLNVPASSTAFTDIIHPGSANNSLETIVMIPQSYPSVELQLNYTLEYLKPDGGHENYVKGIRNTPITVDWKAGEHYVYDLELAFSDVLGETVPFRFTVNGWKKNPDVNTGM